MTIEDEVANLGPLKNGAAAIVDYAIAGAKQNKSQFNKYSHEWTLEPDNWINLRFVYTRANKIHITLGVYPTTLDPVEGVDIKPGRFLRWSKITVENIMQLPAAMRCIEEAFYRSENRYRTQNGKPKRVKNCQNNPA